MKAIEKAYLNVKAVVGETTITVGDFIGLQPGDVIKLDRKVKDDISIVVENRKKFCGIIGIKDKRMAVQITSKQGEEAE